MKAVKLLLIAGGLLIGALLIAGLIAPKEVEVKRSIQIKAPMVATPKSYGNLNIKYLTLGMPLCSSMMVNQV